MTSKQSPIPRLLLNGREASEALDVSQRTLWSLAQSGEVPSIRLGRLVRYRPEALVAWLAAKEKGGEADE